MKIKIAVFGRDELLTRFDDYIHKHDDVEVIPFNYKDAKQAVELIEKSFMCDVNLFLESLPYLYAKNKIKKKRLPVVQVPFDEYMILTSFYHVKNTYNQQLNRLSIDVLDNRYVKEVLTDLELRDSDIYTYNYGVDEPVDLDLIVNFHKKLYEEGKVDYILTSLYEVDIKLKALGIPSYCMVTPKINIDKAIERAKSITTLNKSKSAQIISGYVRIKNWDLLVKENGLEATEELQQKLNQILIKFGEKTFASILPSSDNQYVIFGTRGVLDHITNHFRDFPLLQEIEAAVSTPVEIGFGLGLTAKQAEDHARLAIEACSTTTNSSCYIVNDRQETIGPLGVKKHFDTSRLYQALIHKARLNNELSYNFIDFVKLRNNEPFSSHDIANYYQVTKRSAERTVNKLLSGEVIKVVGEEKPYVKGRPRKLFQINM
ncbi:hypothetical protein [Ornithinibacillus halophilus]|uniref:Transcriptional regulator n=1 Tax=Ornithinibacillus halophilus TaxID=930117 RepID=A0A1M5ID77_9BACI|nr:hypothetical protein [Ornithinibacillus halophilus]SHG26195.1 hypothetical protein SAMN05216225_102325 [Ornithinibacillus halophilus]